MRAIIVDDEKKSQNTLGKMLLRYCPEVELCGYAKNVEEALKLYTQYTPDLLFLDIQMPGGSGFDLLDNIDSHTASVIFTTAHNEYAIKAIRANALDYLLKPINIDELQEAVDRYSKRKKNQKNVNAALNQQIQSFLLDVHPGNVTRIAIPSMNGFDLVATADILHCEAQGSYTHFHLLDGQELIASKNLKTFEEKLLASDFFRVHKSHIVNLKHVVQYVRGDGGYVILRDGTHVDVSKRKKADLGRRLGE